MPVIYPSERRKRRRDDESAGVALRQRRRGKDRRVELSFSFPTGELEALTNELLLESGDQLLLEDGDLLLVE